MTCCPSCGWQWKVIVMPGELLVCGCGRAFSPTTISLNRPPPTRKTGAYRFVRYWYVSHSQLSPELPLDTLHPLTAVGQMVWKPGLNVAEKFRTTGGFYGWLSEYEPQTQHPDLFWGSRSGEYVLGKTMLKVVLGSFIGFGPMHLHTKGCRSMYAVPETIFEPFNLDYASQLLPVAERYRMKMVSPIEAPPAGPISDWVMPDSVKQELYQHDSGVLFRWYLPPAAWR